MTIRSVDKEDFCSQEIFWILYLMMWERDRCFV